MQNGYTLVICEKPDAARRVSDALSDGDSRSEILDGTTIFRFDRGGEEFVVCSAQGHVYGVSDPFDERAVYPIFDVEWYSSDKVDEDNAGAARRISAVKKLASGASKFVNACDFDVEGETIGFNLLRYACGGKEGTSLRAKFSTLTEEDLVAAFENLEPQVGLGLARAGRARHAIDFVWGVNLSRALSQSVLDSGHRYRTVSVGRVQGPALGFLVEREKEIRTFVPTPYWKVSGVFERDGKSITASYSQERIGRKARTEMVREECLGKEAVATAAKNRFVQVGPPVPFNIGDLQKEAYRAFGFTPSRTLQIAERLYLGALISYPRTGSQRLPPSINYRRILQGVGKISEYSTASAELQKGEPKPVQGAMEDPAHPAIHPTGERPRRALDRSEALLFDLVVRRFLSAFGPSARRELVDVSLSVGEHQFKLGGSRTIFPGWVKYYGRYVGYRDEELPQISEGDRFMVLNVLAEEKFDQRSPRYNQSSLLEKMEKERIGTKATRAEIIATLVSRGYVSGESMEVTDLGLSVVEMLARHAPSILSIELTRGIEERLGGIEEGRKGEAELLRGTVRSIAEQLVELNTHEEDVGREIDAALLSTVSKSYVLGRCPVCNTGQLRMIRSKTSKKRFVGCSNYTAGCRASAPLPQRGTIKMTTKTCQHCSWPVVYVMSGRRPWRLCVNSECPGKKKP
ncbi:MAG TPA: DNA topoisomerase I [Nitrososphaerales archaeon]|nr:DNA topoisomerase I [Nitrososphaerales archaeon]